MHHSKVALVVVMMFAVGQVVSFQLRPTYQRTTVPPPPKLSCNGLRNYELSIVTNDQERLEINELIYQIQFESILSMFFDAIHSAVSNGLEVAGSFVGGLAGGFGAGHNAGTKVETKTFYTHKSYRLNGRLRGDEADFRIQSSSGTYSHVVIKIGIVFGVTEIRDAFMQSCDCGETVYLL